jgi:hypothetical protein
VGAVCVDAYGDVAAACSSGGLALKHPGRVGQVSVFIYSDVCSFVHFKRKYKSIVLSKHSHFQETYVISCDTSVILILRAVAEIYLHIFGIMLSYKLPLKNNS